MSIRTSTTSAHPEFFPPPRADRAPNWWFRAIRADSQELVRFWPVIQNMIAQELRVKYQRSVLGFLWTLLNPILMMITLSLVFSQLFSFRDMTPQAYALYLFSGMLPWGFLFMTVSECAICILANEVLIRKIYLPKLVFPLSKMLLNLTMLVLSMAALFLLLIPLGARFAPTFVLLPLATLLFAAFVLGLGLMVAVINTFYRDFGHLVSVVLQAWYFATPIIYPVSQLPEEVRWRFWLNPAYPFIRTFQLIIEGTWPEGVLLLVSAGIAAVSLGVGYATFKAYENKLVFRL